MSELRFDTWEDLGESIASEFVTVLTDARLAGGWCTHCGVVQSTHILSDRERLCDGCYANKAGT